MAAKKTTKKKAAKSVKARPAAGRRARTSKPGKSGKPAAKPKPAATTRPARTPGERRYWLVKTEPEVFSFSDLLAAPEQTTCWDGVRNYQARNFLRDEMKPGDGVLVYHSNAEPPAIVGVAEIVREGYPDHTQFDPKHHHFDPDADPALPTWFMVDLKAVKPLPRFLGLPELREVPELRAMTLLQKGSRLSVQPVSAAEWETVLRLGQGPAGEKA